MCCATEAITMLMSSWTPEMSSPTTPKTTGRTNTKRTRTAWLRMRRVVHFEIIAYRLIQPKIRTIFYIFCTISKKGTKNKIGKYYNLVVRNWLCKQVLMKHTSEFDFIKKKNFNPKLLDCSGHKVPLFDEGYGCYV